VADLASLLETAWAVRPLQERRKNVERVNALIQEDRQINVFDIADRLDVSCGSAYSIIHEDSGYHRICSRWIPKQLTDENKGAHMETCMQILKLYREGESFPATDCHRRETWVCHRLISR